MGNISQQLFRLHCSIKKRGVRAGGRALDSDFVLLERDGIQQDQQPLGAIV